MQSWPPPPFDPDRTREIVSALGDASVPAALHAVHDEFGYVDRAAVRIIAELLEEQVTDVHRTLARDPDLRMTKPTRGLVRVCTFVGCDAKGSRDILAAVRGMLGCTPGQASTEGIVVEAVYCLGNCFLGPTVSIDGRLIPAATPELLDRELATLRATMAVGAPSR